MCHETPADIGPRIVALLVGETVPWTGNEILGRIAAGDVPCELHFDETIRQMVREGALTSDSDAFAPTLTSTTRCRLAFILSPEVKATTKIQPLPKAPTIVAPLPPRPAPPPPPPAAPALPSPAVRLDLIGRLREDRARVEKEWFERFGADCFRNGPSEFLKTLFLQARTYGMVPRLRDAAERALGRSIPDFERHCENLLLLNDRDGTIPVVTIDSGVKLDLMYYVSLDLDRAESDVREGREGNPGNARELLGFLKEMFDKPALRKALTERPSPPPPPKERETEVLEPILLPPLPKTEPKAPPVDPILGMTFGQYKVVSLIGKGGMGAVYEGVDETLDRHVALKILHSQFTDNREHQDRFLREARNAANSTLDHPNITQVYAAGRQGPHLWLAMQLVRGRTLTAVLEERKKLPAPEALRIARQIAEGLAMAHAAQMIHRDIKPDNLMIDDSGRVKIMDFGLMRSVDAKKDGLTADGLFVGTVEYASPEQCRDKTLDARTDLYSLGVVLYELLCGKRPYKARNAFGYLSMIPDPKQPPAPLRSIESSVPPGVEALVHRMIAKNRDDRFASAQDLVKAIDAAPTAPAADPAVLRGAAKSAMASLILWSLALAAAIAAIIILWPKSEEPAKTGPAPTPVAPAVPDAKEKEAEAAYLKKGEDDSLRRLLTDFAATAAGARAARETFDAFEKSLPQIAAWEGWEKDLRDAPNGTAAFDAAKNIYVLAAPTTKEQVRLLKKLSRSTGGYRVSWLMAPDAADSAAFMIALSLSSWFETGPRGLTLYRAEGEKVANVRRIEFPQRVQGGVFTLFPRAGLVLVYLDGRLILALPEKEYALGAGLQLGISGGTVNVESIRVLD